MCTLAILYSNMHSLNTYIDYTILIALTGMLCTVLASSYHVHNVQLKAPGMERSMQACRTGTPALPHQMVPGVSFRAYLPLLVRMCKPVQHALGNVICCTPCLMQTTGHTPLMLHICISFSLSISGNFQCVCVQPSLQIIYAPLLQLL